MNKENKEQFADENSVAVDVLRSLDRIIKCAIKNPRDLVNNVQVIDEAIPFNAFPWLNTALEEYCIYKHHKTKCTEQDVYNWFDNNYKLILGNNYYLTKHTDDEKHKPDRWIKVDKELIPVECKLGVFNDRSMQQLDRYMRFYKCQRGVAVGSKLNVSNFPANKVIFIQHEVTN